jgi:hypothetical protein
MGGDDSQKLRPWRGSYSSPGRSKPPDHSEINTVTENCDGISRDATFLGHPGRGSATGCLGHFWKADLGHFSQAPKRLRRCAESWSLLRPRPPR